MKKKRLGAIAIVVAAVAAAALSARPTNGAPSTVRQESDAFNIDGIGELDNASEGTFVSTLGFEGTASPFKQISFFGASDWHFTKQVSSLPGSICSLTPANGGATCSFANPQQSVVGGRFAVDAIFIGTPPTSVAGEVVFADGISETFSASITYPPSPKLLPPYITDAVLTGMKDGTPGLGFMLRGAEAENALARAKFTAFDVTLPGGLGFNRAKVAKGTACHGLGRWTSSSINTKKTRCTPRIPISGATVVTDIAISAIHEGTNLEREVRDHTVAKLPFWVTVEGSKGDLVHLRAVAAIKNWRRRIGSAEEKSR